MQRLSGCWFKLFDPDGTHLGVVIVPEDVARYLETERQVTVAQRFPPIRAFESVYNITEVTVRQFYLAEAMYPNDGVMLFNITPEQLSLEPGFAFTPGSGYRARPAQTIKVPPMPNRFTEVAREVFG